MKEYFNIEIFRLEVSFFKMNKYFFIGIGGILMSVIVLIFKN